jgi:hypothetical protein
MPVEKKFTFVVSQTETPQIPLLRELYHKVLAKEFDEHELEELPLWEQLLTEGDADDKRYRFYVGIVLAEDGSVAGGVVYELYKHTACALIAYITVREDMRGCGLAKYLLTNAFAHVQAESERLLNEPLKGMFLEVLRTTDNGPDANHGFDPVTRQVIYARMGFCPVDVVIVHPGRLRGFKYQTCFWSTLVDHTTATQIPAKLVRDFFAEVFEGILDAEEDGKVKVDRHDVAVWKASFEGLESLPCGPNCWK